jgi:hypothetical protein
MGKVMNTIDETYIYAPVSEVGGGILQDVCVRVT